MPFVINKYTGQPDYYEAGGSGGGGGMTAHSLVGADHTASGLTPGQFLKSLTSTTFGFAAHGLGYSDVGALAAGTKLDDLASPDDNADLNAGTGAHGLAPKAVAPAAGLLNVLGVANGETIWSNKPAFDTTNPAAGAATASPGSQVVAARRDHVHAIFDSTAPLGLDVSASAGTNLIASRTDHVHPGHNLLSAVHLDSLTRTPVLGDMIFANATPLWGRVPGNTSAALGFLTQTGTGSLPEALLDGHLESWTSPSTLTKWTAGVAGASTVNRDGTHQHTLLYCARMDVDASNSLADIHQGSGSGQVPIPLTPGGNYVLSFWYYNSVAGKTYVAELYTIGGEKYLKSDGTWASSLATILLDNKLSYYNFSLAFAAPATYTQYILAFRNDMGGADASSSSFYIDDISIGAPGATSASPLWLLQSQIALDTWGAPTDITTLNASTSAHGLVVKVTAPATGLLNVVGAGYGEAAYTCKALFDNTNPAAPGTAAPGTSLIAARRDHVHPVYTHNILSSTHSDSTAASAVRGDIITAQGASPVWARLALGNSGYFFKSDGTDAKWAVHGLDYSDVGALAAGAQAVDSDKLDGSHAAAFELALGNPGVSGYILSSTSAGVRSWVVNAAAATFLALTDTPASYSGAGGYVVKVNAGATALEFVAGGAGVVNFKDLADVPASYAGQGGKYVRVNAGASALEFTTPPAGAPVTSAYILQTADANLANAQALGSLAGGIMKVAATTGIVSIATPGSDYLASAPKLDDCAAPDNNTDLNASTSAHGLLLIATAPAAGFLNVVGIANAETAYACKALYDATLPATAGGIAACGTSLSAARRDHVHPHDRRFFAIYAENAAFVGVGVGALTTAGTLSNTSDDVAAWTSIAATTQCVAYSAGTTSCRIGHNPSFYGKIKTGASIATFRIWVGLGHDAITNTDDNAGDYALFRYSSVVGSNWYACTKDGSTINAQDTGLACQANTVYEFRITATASAVIFTINGAYPITSSVHLPTVGIGLMLWCWVSSGVASHTVSVCRLQATCD